MSEQNGGILGVIGFFATSLLSIFGVAFAFAEEDRADLNVNVSEILSVSVSTPSTWASGDVDTFLRNKVSINVTSNNSAGFTASMTTKTADTSLTNASKNTATLPTLAANATRSSFPANYWGYSLDDTESGNSASTYRALVGAGNTPITILSSPSASSGSKDFYFGAKANITQASGTYTGTVVISVVSGVLDNTTNPITPTNPASPNLAINTPTYNSATNSTSYTYVNTSSGTGGSASVVTTTTDVSSGDTRGVYNNYVPPQGVSNISNTSSTTSLATGLAMTSIAAISSSAFLFILANRRLD